MKENPHEAFNLSAKSVDTFDFLNREIQACEPTKTDRLIEKITTAALGNIPAIGIGFSIMAAYKNDEGQLKANKVFKLCHDVYRKKFETLEETLSYIHARLDSINTVIEERLTTESFEGILSQSFKAWDKAETQEKRRIVANLIVNSAATRATSDDVIRLFIGWIDLYHESHFALMRYVFHNSGCTRYEIYTSVFGELPREDSAESDMFKLLIRDLSTNNVIRQEREITNDGHFVKHRQQRRNPNKTTLESAFDDTKRYTLTELGKQFIHYAMNESVTNIGDI